MFPRILPLLLLVCLSCGSSEKTNNSSIRSSDTLRGVDPARFIGDAIRSDTSTAIITLERTACFGTCPLYTLAIYEDGTVIYNGLRFVREMGLRVANIGTETVEDLFANARRISYTSLSERYDGTATDPAPTDLPSAITSVRFGDAHKIVHDYWGAPQQLRKFERRIDELTRVERWLGDVRYIDGDR